MASKLALALGLSIMFGITVLILVKVMPGPLRPTDYLVMGTVATLVCILAVFLFSLTATSDPFRRRRK